jgi:chaperone BCS1
MTEILAWLTSLPQNPMFAGLTGATVIGGLLVLARQLPVRLLQWALMCVSAQVTVKSQDPVFWWVVNWLSVSTYGRTARRMRLESVVGGASDAPAIGGNSREEVRYVLSPADGMHWFFYRGALVVVSRGKEGSPGGSSQTWAREEIHVRAFTLGSRQYIARLIDEAQQSLKTDDDSTRVHSNEHWNWSAATLVPRRPIESVILREGLAQMLVNDAQTFFASRQWYRDRAIPWRRGYLLHGEPGCGKSSIAHALASHLGMNIAVLSLASVAGDTPLRSLMANMPHKCLLLIEDIDSAFAKREGKDSEFVTFSGLLNAIDGIAAAEGRILVMTTNHLDQIDPALRRPGRADVEVCIEPADESQAKRMFLRFFPEQSELADIFAQRYAGQSPAAIQGVLVANRADALAACEAMKQPLLEVA